MIINLFNDKKPITITEKQAESIKEAILNNQDFIIIGKEIIRVNSIQSVRNEEESWAVKLIREQTEQEQALLNEG